MSNIEAPEARELSLVGKVEMRIALANDVSLSKTLNTYLAPLLLKLASEFVSVRNKASKQYFPAGDLSSNMAVSIPYYQSNFVKSYSSRQDKQSKMSSIATVFPFCFVSVVLQGIRTFPDASYAGRKFACHAFWQTQLLVELTSPTDCRSYPFVNISILGSSHRP